MLFLTVRYSSPRVVSLRDEARGDNDWFREAKVTDDEFIPFRVDFSLVFETLLARVLKRFLAAHWDLRSSNLV